MSKWKAFPQSKPRGDGGLYLVTVLRNGFLLPEIRMWSGDRFIGVGKVLAFMSIPEPYRPTEPKECIPTEAFKADCSRKF